MTGTKLDPSKYLEDATRNSLARLTLLLDGIATPETLIGNLSDAEKFLLKDLADRVAEMIEHERRNRDQYCQDLFGPEVSQARMGTDDGEDNIPF